MALRSLIALAAPVLLFALACGGGGEVHETNIVAAVDTDRPAPPLELDEPQEPELHTAWMVITFSSTDKALAEEQLASYQERKLPSRGDYPMVLDSSTVQGLKPDIWIVVTAVPADMETARTMAAALDPHNPGSYVREVQVRDPEYVFCDEEPDPRCAVAGWRALVIFDSTPTELKSEDWGWFTYDVQTALSPHGVVSVSVGDDHTGDVVIDGEVVGTVDISPFWDEGMGYVFAQDGKGPEYHPHDMSGSVIRAAGAYYGIDVER